MRFGKRMIEAVRQGRKTLTIRKSPRKLGVKIVEEGGRTFYDHVDTGLRIRITEVWPIHDIDTYVLENYDAEGFDSPADMVKYIRNDLKMKKFPPCMWAHRFYLIRGGPYQS